ncbi:MAG: DsrE family protein [Actinomycetota bacterium]|jgi:uncharacterized protein involved in oxidation of intracellular sulfur|nr:DsrE family protein [Actinomycetota bacterium]
MKMLILLNDPPYGTERSYNGLRLAGSLAKRDGVAVKVFLFGDAVGCAMANQKVPDGYYHLDRMLRGVIGHGGEVGCCGTCMDARALAEDGLVEGAHRSSMEEVTDWTLWADKVVTF